MFVTIIIIGVLFIIIGVLVAIFIRHPFSISLIIVGTGFLFAAFLFVYPYLTDDTPVCPEGYDCTPIPVCPDGFTCTPIETKLPTCEPGYELKDNLCVKT